MKKILLIITIFLLGIINVYALDGNVTSISVKEKSSTIIVEEPSVTNNSIDAKVTFKNVGDYVIFTLGLDIDSSLYTIESVTDNNESEHIKTTYTINEDKIEMKLEYESALTTSMDLDDIEITINLKDKEGNTETLVVNPGTGDNIIKYVAILGISTLTLTGLLLLRKKKTALGLILLIAIIPTVVIAEDKMKLNVELAKDDIKVGYDVVFVGGTGSTGSTDTKLCYFGEECTLPANEFENAGKAFKGWATEVNGEVVYLDEVGVTNLAPGGEFELFAVWQNTAAQTISEINTLEEVADAKRYSGANPDNYVFFNGELWRIIGVYDNNLKIVKATPVVTNQAYMSYGSRAKWDGSDAQTYLIETYYPSLSDDAKAMIYEQGSWNVGFSEPVLTNATPAKSYTMTKSEIWTGKIGLVATYEFLYAAENDGVCWESSGFDYSTNDCASKNWLRDDLTDNKTYDAWLLNPFDNNYTFCVTKYTSGYIYNFLKSYGLKALSPVVYLKESVIITDGTGTIGDPYILE